MNKLSVIQQTPGSAISNQISDNRVSYNQSQASKLYTHISTLNPNDNFINEESVGKDHNKISNKYNLYPYSQQDQYQIQQYPSHVTYRVSRNQSESSNWIKYLIFFVIIIVVIFMSGLLFWFFKNRNSQTQKQPQKLQSNKLKNTSPTKVKKQKIQTQPQIIFKSKQTVFHCPPPGFIHANKCMKCPSNYSWNGTNCILESKQPNKQVKVLKPLNI